jgi:glucose-1-phosphate thymidylyltransferase
MKIIIPMAGRGSRLRPHTLTVPKPLLPVAGKPIVQRLVEDLTASYKGKVEEIAFITGDFGEAVNKQLIQVAEGLGAKGSVYRQEQPLGTAHAILCAAESLSGNCIVAFADTLFKASFDFDPNVDGMIWVQQVKDPSAFGVVKVDANNVITDFVEKSPVFVSDLAIVGIYYFNDGENLKKELQYLLDNDIKDRGEYQLTNALENMKQKGLKFRPGKIDEWLDCGNKEAVIFTNGRMLDLKKDQQLISKTVQLENAVIIPPCFIGENVKISNSVIGPYVSIGDNSTIVHSVIANSVIQHKSKITNANLTNSMLGSEVEYIGKASDISIGDYSQHIV